MNNALSQLQPYPFEKLRALLGSVTPNPDKRPIALSIGEPKHRSPSFVAEALASNLEKMAVYPTTLGIPELREAIAAWCERRFNVPAGWLDPARHVLPVNGTREALFAFTQTVVNRGDDALVVSPNPFYQIYEGAAFLAGAKPHYLPCLDENGFNPDFDAVSPDIWKRCQILFLCSPGNPTGALIPVDTLKKLIALADEYDFVIAADECYSELYFDEQTPPPGLLSACVELGRNDFKRCVVFHSLSKRSNLPGLRSGSVAGDADILKGFLLAAAALFLFTCMDSITKYLTSHYNVPFVVAMRYLVHCSVMLIILAPRHATQLVKTQRTGLVVLRGLALTLSSLCMGMALQRMPLAETTAINFLAPTLVALLEVMQPSAS